MTISTYIWIGGKQYARFIRFAASAPSDQAARKKIISHMGNLASGYVQALLNNPPTAIIGERTAGAWRMTALEMEG